MHNDSFILLAVIKAVKHRLKSEAEDKQSRATPAKRLQLLTQEEKRQRAHRYLHSWCPVLVKLCVSVSSRDHHFFPKWLVRELRLSLRRRGGHQNAARAPCAWRTSTSRRPEPRDPRAGSGVQLLLLGLWAQRWWDTVPLQKQKQKQLGWFFF